MPDSSQLEDSFLSQMPKAICQTALSENCLTNCFGHSREETSLYLRTVLHFALGLLEKELASI